MDVKFEILKKIYFYSKLLNYRRESSTLSDRSTVSSIQGKGFITPDKLDRQVREGGGYQGRMQDSIQGVILLPFLERGRGCTQSPYGD